MEVDAARTHKKNEGLLSSAMTAKYAGVKGSPHEAFELLSSTHAAGSLSVAQAADSPVGYTDTPEIPGQKWRVHDANRPAPKVVTPGTTFSHSAPAPSDAVILFDGHDLSKWKTGNKPAGWQVENGYMEASKLRTQSDLQRMEILRKITCSTDGLITIEGISMSNQEEVS